jgi:integrase
MRFRPSDLYKIRLCTAATGEQIPLIIDAHSGLPVVRPNQFVLVSRRDRCQVGTLRGDLSDLTILLSWARHCNIDLDGLLDRGTGLDQVAVTSLVDALRGDYRGRRDGNMVPLQRPLVSAEVWADRIATTRDYIAWNLANLLSSCEPGTMRYQHVRERRDEFIRAMDGRVPKIRKGNRRKGLVLELKTRLHNIVAPGSPENPFQEALQERNALIIDVLQTLGLRRAELCKLRTSHFRAGPRPTLFVERLPDDPEDPRPNQPQVKTLSRLLPLDARLAARIQRYILNDRHRLPNAKRTPFLFLARSGEPIALGTINKIFDQIVRWHPEFSGLLTPHVLRHTANDDLSETIEQSGCSREEATSIRNFLNGWEPGSSQGTKYNQRYIESRAAEVSLAHQHRIFSKEGVE